MKNQYYKNGRFEIAISRYKNETKYEASYIEKVKEDFSHHSFKGIEDAERLLRELATYHKKPNNTHIVETGISGTYTNGSVASKYVSIKIKPYGSYTIYIQESFKPNECFK